MGLLAEPADVRELIPQMYRANWAAHGLSATLTSWTDHALQTRMLHAGRRLAPPPGAGIRGAGPPRLAIRSCSAWAGSTGSAMCGTVPAWSRAAMAARPGRCSRDRPAAPGAGPGDAGEGLPLPRPGRSPVPGLAAPPVQPAGGRRLGSPGAWPGWRLASVAAAAAGPGRALGGRAVRGRAAGPGGRRHRPAAPVRGAVRGAAGAPLGAVRCPAGPGRGPGRRTIPGAPGH